MAKYSDNEILRDVIELFFVRHFDNIEFAGRVTQKKVENINYFSVDLDNFEWDKKVDELNGALTKYLSEWIRKNSTVLNDYISLSEITVEYLLPKADGAIQNKAKSLRLLYLPSYYYSVSTDPEQGLKKNRLYIKWLSFWNTLAYRYLIIVAFLIAALSFISNNYFNSYPSRMERLGKVFDFTNIATSIIASFILGYIVTKVLTIRSEKLSRAEEVIKLSNKLTYFRKICFNFLRNHNYWSQTNPYIVSFNHGNSIKNLISYEDFNYPSYDDPIKYAKYRSLINDQLSFPIVNLVLQLYMFADEEYFNSGLTHTSYPPNYVYCVLELDQFILMTESNSIWYCADEKKYFPETFPVGYYTTEMLKDMERIDTKYKATDLTREQLSKISLDFQYDILPRLYRLLKANEAPLPIIIKYFTLTSSLLLIFSIIVPSLLYLFVEDSNYAFFSIYIVFGVIIHILLSLKELLKEENRLDTEDDYI